MPDRLDLRTEVPVPRSAELLEARRGEPDELGRGRALTARVREREREALNAVCPEGSETGRLDRVFERLQAASLPKEDW